MKTFSVSTSILTFSINSLLTCGAFAADVQPAPPSNEASAAAGKAAKKPPVQKLIPDQTAPPLGEAPTTASEPSPAKQELIAHAAKSAATLSGAQKTMLLKVVNTGDNKTLTALFPGIGENKASAIVAARPFKTVGDLLLVKAIGQTSFDRIISCAKSDGPPPWDATAGKALSEQKTHGPTVDLETPTKRN